MAKHYEEPQTSNFSVLRSSDSLVLGSADSLSLPSEPPHIRNWFSSYAYESPSLNTCDDFEGPAFRGRDCVEEGFDNKESNKEKEENLEEFRKSRNKDELVIGEVVSNGFVKSDKTGDHNQQIKNASQVVGPSDSLSLSSEPPDITRWFPTYAYESPALDTNDDCRDSIFIESECQRVGCNSENCSKETEENLREFRRATKRHVSAAADGIYSNDLIKSNSSIRDNKHDQQYRIEGIHGLAWDKMSSVANDFPVEVISGEVLKVKPTEKHDISSAQHVERRDFIEGNSAQKDKRRVLACANNLNLFAVTGDSIRKLTSGTSDRENDRMISAGNGFISTRKDRSANTSLERSMEVQSDWLRNRATVPSVVGNEDIPRRQPLSEKTNFQKSDASGITGKWHCPQKSKPNVGPPLKQLRLERWVHRV